MRVVAIIQARMGSTRLPGKVLRKIAGRTMLDRVVQRTRRASLIDELVVATSTSEADDAIVAECQRRDFAWFRGNEDDVLDRYFAAAEALRADAIVRVTSDCPLVDGSVIDQVVSGFLRELPDYASNFLIRTFPRGLDSEILSAQVLARAWCEASRPYERVHVTPYLYEHPELFRLLAVTGREDFSGGRWTVDTADDLRFVRAVYERFGGSDRFSWREVWSLLEQEPALRRINSHVRQKAVHDESLAASDAGGVAPPATTGL